MLVQNTSKYFQVLPGIAKYRQSTANKLDAYSTPSISKHQPFTEQRKIFLYQMRRNAP
jgi:hypothetical protein